MEGEVVRACEMGGGGGGGARESERCVGDCVPECIHVHLCTCVCVHVDFLKIFS